MAKKERVVLTTPIFRVGYPNLFAARAFEDGGKKKYDVCAIFTPASYTGVEKERWDALCKALDDACQAQFGMGWKEARKVDQETGAKAVPNFKDGLYNGKARADSPGFGNGTFYATLSTEYPPDVVKYNGKGNKSTVISDEDGNTDEMYAGCYARAKVGVYAYSNKSKGVAIGLNSVQKIKDGEKLAGRGNPADAFEDDVDGAWAEQNEPSVDDEDIPF